MRESVEKSELSIMFCFIKFSENDTLDTLEEKCLVIVTHYLSRETTNDINISNDI